MDLTGRQGDKGLCSRPKVDLLLQLSVLGRLKQTCRLTKSGTQDADAISPMEELPSSLLSMDSAAPIEAFVTGALWWLCCRLSNPLLTFKQFNIQHPAKHTCGSSPDNHRQVIQTRKSLRDTHCPSDLQPCPFALEVVKTTSKLHHDRPTVPTTQLIFFGHLFPNCPPRARDAPSHSNITVAPPIDDPPVTQTFHSHTAGTVRAAPAPTRVPVPQTQPDHEASRQRFTFFLYHHLRAGIAATQLLPGRPQPSPRGFGKASPA